MTRRGATTNVLNHSTSSGRSGTSGQGYQSAATSDELGRGASLFCVALGLATLVTGVWAFVAPASFFEVIAPFEPFNRHFIRDAGAFSVGVSAALLLLGGGQSAAVVGLGGYTVSAVLHLISHVVDRDLGGNPARDFPYLTLLAVAGVAGQLSVRRRSLLQEGKRSRG